MMSILTVFISSFNFSFLSQKFGGCITTYRLSTATVCRVRRVQTDCGAHEISLETKPIVRETKTKNPA